LAVYGVVNRHGFVVRGPMPIALPLPILMQDFAITQHYTIVMDLPFACFFDLPFFSRLLLLSLLLNFQNIDIYLVMLVGFAIHFLFDSPLSSSSSSFLRIFKALTM
jgi:hypothetical protein